MHTMEYYLAFKKKEIMLLVTPWMNMEGTRLCEISQTEKDNTWYDLYMACEKESKSSTQRSRE